MVDTFNAIPDWLEIRTELNSTEKRVYGKIKRYVIQYKDAYPNQERIAYELGLTEKTVSKAIVSLASLRLIEVTVSGRSNRYSILEHVWEHEEPKPFISRYSRRDYVSPATHVTLDDDSRSLDVITHVVLSNDSRNVGGLTELLTKTLTETINIEDIECKEYMNNEEIKESEKAEEIGGRVDDLLLRLKKEDWELYNFFRRNCWGVVDDYFFEALYEFFKANGIMKPSPNELVEMSESEDQLEWLRSFLTSRLLVIAA